MKIHTWITVPPSSYLKLSLIYVSSEKSETFVYCLRPWRSHMMARAVHIFIFFLIFSWWPSLHVFLICVRSNELKRRFMRNLNFQIFPNCLGSFWFLSILQLHHKRNILSHLNFYSNCIKSVINISAATIQGNIKLLLFRAELLAP